MCNEQVDVAQSHLPIGRVDLDALQKRHESVDQRIAKEKTLYFAHEEKGKLKEYVKALS